MVRLYEGRVVLVTDAGRREGATVMVNDIVTNLSEFGGDSTSAVRVVEEIRADSGKAAANVHSVGSFQEREQCSIKPLTPRGIDIVVNNAGILRDRHANEHDGRAMGLRHRPT